MRDIEGSNHPGEEASFPVYQVTTADVIEEREWDSVGDPSLSQIWFDSTPPPLSVP